MAHCDCARFDTAFVVWGYGAQHALHDCKRFWRPFCIYRSLLFRVRSGICRYFHPSSHISCWLGDKTTVVVDYAGLQEKIDSENEFTHDSESDCDYSTTMHEQYEIYSTR